MEKKLEEIIAMQKVLLESIQSIQKETVALREELHEYKIEMNQKSEDMLDVIKIIDINVTEFMQEYIKGYNATSNVFVQLGENSNKATEVILEQMQQYHSSLDRGAAHTMELVAQKTYDLISYHETTQKIVQQVYTKIEDESKKLNRSIGATQNTTRFS
ncbi:hypothetical protein [Sulfurimonas sp. NW9]|uniref:hypothetical protein n=1 Tax=Sulfurimonas sp. NW9 TaxID=2922728 RepID=UPI003DA7F513